MNIIKLKYALIGLTLISSINVFSQVGIGVASPNSKSILDLTNTNSKGLLLPTLTSAPASTAGPEGMMFYFDSLLYVRDGVGFNGITPWRYKYNGSTNEVVYFSPASYVGVGIGVNDVSIKGNLHITLNSKEVVASGTSAVLFIGNTDASTHMIFDNDELMVKTNPTTGGLMKIQEEDGSLMIGSDRTEAVDSLRIHLNTTVGSQAHQKDVNIYGKVMEYGHDLLPVGTIIMWSGNTAPAGWALCDGGSYAKMDGSGNITVPDLRGRFIVGYNNSDADYNNAATGTAKTGGAKTVALTTGNLPDHTHTGNTNNDGAHQHTSQPKYLADNDDNDDTGYYVGESGGDDPQGQSGTHDITSSGSSHSHAFTTSGCTNCTGTAHENRPPYYTLAFIYKL